MANSANKIPFNITQDSVLAQEMVLVEDVCLDVSLLHLLWLCVHCAWLNKGLPSWHSSCYHGNMLKRTKVGNLLNCIPEQGM